MLQNRSFVFLLLALSALVAGFATGRELWFMLTYLLGLILVLSFLWAWINISRTRITRRTRSRRTQVGQPLEERLQVVNTSWLPKLWLEVRDYSDFPGHQVSRVVSGLGPGKHYSWRATTVSRLRGRYRLGPVLIRSGDPFGLFPLERRIATTNHVVVLPLTVDLPDVPLPQGLLSGGEALRRRTYQVTTNASGVREYAPGDSFSRIHWRSTARRGRLIVKEFELDPLADVWVLPDMSAASQFTRPGAELGIAVDLFGAPAGLPLGRPTAVAPTLPAATEEYIVTIAASLARYFLRQDRAVGMLAYGQTTELVQPDRGDRQQNRILETLAVLRASGATGLPGTLLAESVRFARGATLLVVTASTDERWAGSARELTRRGLKVVTVLVDPESFGDERSSAALYAYLLAHGLTTYLVREGDDLMQVFTVGRGRR